MADFPDIQKSSSSLVKYIIFTVATVAIFSGVALTIKSMTSDNADEKRRSFIKSTGLPDGFFYSDTEEKSTIEKPEANEIEKKRIERIKQQQLAKQKNRKKKKTKRRLTKKEIFLIEEKKKTDNALIRRRNLINEKRLKAKLTRVASSDSENGKKFVKNLSEKDWSRYGVEKDIASLPVELSRTLTADRMIPCLLVNEILTDLGGQVTCKVEENIYGAHGRKILIPAHTSAIGRFSPLKKVGDERVRLLWSRMITPNGININTTNAELTDTMGRSGATAEIDRRYTEKYGLALLFSTISNMAAYQVPVDSVNQQIIISNYTKDLSSTTNKILDEQINIKPRGRVPAGSRIFINPVRDIWFSKPKNKTITLSIKE